MAMSHYTGEDIESSILDDIMSRYFPNGFSDEQTSISDPYLDELEPYQQNSCSPFSFSSAYQDDLSLLQDETDLSPIIHSQSFTSIDMQSSSLPFIDQFPETGDIFLSPQPHILQNQELSDQTCMIPLLPNTGLSYELEGTSQIPRVVVEGDFHSEGAMDSLLPRTAEQVSPHTKTSQKNQIPATTETHNMNESDGENLEAINISSSYEFNVQRVEVTRPRVHWTEELHECFVQAVNSLGGPDRTTPRCILIKMGVDGLTIDHVKSHLQKYRYITRYQSEANEEKASCSEGNKRNSTGKESKLTKVSNKESETLQMQWELQKTLHDQLEVIRELQIQTEENGRRLQVFMENHNKMQEALLQGTQSSPLKCKIDNSEESSAQISRSEGNKALPNQDNTEEEDCYIIETNFEFTPVHKKARVHT